MASLRPLFANFFSLLFLYLGCFIFASRHHHQSRKRSNHHSSPPSRLKVTSQKALSFLKHLFSASSSSKLTASTPHPAASFPSPASSTRSLHHPIIIPLTPDPSPVKIPLTLIDNPESDISTASHLLPLRNNIYPCTICGEVFQKPNLLELHRSIKHAVTELFDGDSGKNIVQIIFKTGWPNRNAKTPVISRILKIHSSQKILNKFEEYRECVKSKAASKRRDDERCLVDGNELLRFHCTTLLCDLGRNGNSGLCNQQYCSVCGIIRSGFSNKMDGISTMSTSWRAHVAIPEEIEEEFEFMHVKRAMLVCRVIAGRVGCDPGLVDKADPGFDSLVGGGGSEVHGRLDEDDELLVFNPRAVLPCFVIIYSTTNYY